MAEARVYVVDDDAAVRKALSLLLETVGYRVGSFADPTEFLARLSALEPGCIVIDIRMPKLSGLRLQESLGEMAPHWPVVVISGHGDLKQCRQVFKNGAIDFLSKPVDEQDLIDAIQAGMRQLAEATREQQLKDENRALLARLTPREAEILELICQGLTSREIADVIAVSPRTVESHRASIAEKIGTTSVAEMARLVFESRG